MEENERGPNGAMHSLPPRPAPAWMWKPRSTLVNDEGKSKSAKSWLQLRRIGASQWNRRYVFLKDLLLCYGKDKDRGDKQVPFELIREVRVETREEMLRRHAPEAYASFGWLLAVRGRSIYFCAEDAETSTAWVRYLTSLLESLRESSRNTAHLSVAPLQPPLEGSESAAGLWQGTAATPGLLSAGATMAEIHSTLQRDGTAIAEKESAAPAALPAEPPDPEERASSAGSGAGSGAMDASSEDTEGNDECEESDRAEGLTPGAEPAQPESSTEGASTDPEQLYARVLLPIAAETHSHIGYRIESLVPHFRSGDDESCVVFSRIVEKVGKHDNAQVRELVLTSRHLYLFHKPRLGGGVQVRCINTRDITGVVESTTDRTMVAVLVPSFHDVLLRVVPQNSCVAGTLVEVKQQLLAHLYAAHHTQHTDHRFLFKEAAAVSEVVRRTEEAKFAPLRSLPGDQMEVATRPLFLSTFAANADEAVYWSSIVRQVRAERKPQLRALVVTESAVYLLSDNLQDVVSRTFGRDVASAMYDRDAQSILLKCREVDLLFNMQSSVEFHTFLQVLPEAMRNGFGRAPRVTASKQLYSHARLLTHSTLSLKGTEPGKGGQAEQKRGGGFLSLLQRKGGGWKTAGRRHGEHDKLPRGFEDQEDEAVNEGHYLSVLQGDYSGHQALRLFCAQFRIVEELILDYDDALRLLSTHEAEPPAGMVKDAVTLAYSTLCHLLDAKECWSLLKESAVEMHEQVVQRLGAPHILHISREGIAFTKAPATFSLPGGIPEPPTVRVPWTSVAAVVRCHVQGGTSVAVLTNRTHEQDYLFHVPQTDIMMSVVSAAIFAYTQYRQTAPYCPALLPVYAAARAQSLAKAMKKTVYDPFPTVAMRYTPSSFASDRLRVAYIPDVADALRRYGDNTVFFSGVAWRVRSATLRKYSGRLEEDPGATMCRRNNHLYKSFILLITNVAIYHCTKGGFEVVRRTLLTDVTSIVRQDLDEDTVMLTVPSEYDMYLRVERRGEEMVARLQEAFTEWTNLGHYAPGEVPESHDVADYELPTRCVPCVAVVGELTKPPTFNDLQASRTAEECRRISQQWHLRRLRRAIAGYERAVVAARKGRPTASPSPGIRTWVQAKRLLANRQSYLYFTQRRCFRFGLSSDEFDEMQRAQLLLYEHKQCAHIARRLAAAVQTANVDAYKAAVAEARQRPALRLLVEEETAVYERYCQRQLCVSGMLDALVEFHRDTTARGAARVEYVVLGALSRAGGLGADCRVLGQMRQTAQVMVQRALLFHALVAAAAGSPLQRTPGYWMLLHEATRALRCPPTLYGDSVAVECGGAAPAATTPRTAAATEALRSSLLLGEPEAVRRASRYASRLLEQPSDATSTEKNLLHRAINYAQQELAVYAQHHEVVEAKLAEFSGAIHEMQQCQVWTVPRVEDLQRRCAALRDSVPHNAALFEDYRRVLRMHQNTLTEQKQWLQRHAEMERHEETAQRHYAKQLERLNREAANAAGRQQRREKAEQRQRNKKAASMWTQQAQSLCSSIDRLMGSSEEAADTEIRMGVKQCVHLQRAMDRVAESSDAGSDGAPHLVATLQGLQEELRATAAKAQDYLMRCSSSGQNPYKDSSAPLSSRKGDGEERVPDAGSAAMPDELQDAIDAGNTAALGTYFDKHSGAATVPLSAAVRSAWREAREKERWVQQLHQGLHVAATLHNTELLKFQLHLASQRGHSDAAVRVGRQLMDKILEKGGQWPARKLQPTVNKEEYVGSFSADPSSGEIALATSSSSSLSLQLSPGTQSLDEQARAENYREPLSENFPAGPDDDGQNADAGALESLLLTLPPMNASSITPPGCLQVVRHLYEATRRLLLWKDNELRLNSVASASPAGDYAVSVAKSNPHKTLYVDAWLRVLRHGLRPLGFFRQAPRGVCDVVQSVAELKAKGDYIAPYVTRLDSDFKRLYRSKRETEEEKWCSDVVLVELALLTQQTEHFVKSLGVLSEGQRKDMLLDSAALAHRETWQGIVAAAHIAGKLHWPFKTVQAFATECFVTQPRAANPPNSPPTGAAAAPPVPPTPEAMPPTAVSAPEARQTLRGSLPLPTGPPASVRQQNCTECLQQLSGVVHAITDYFTQKLHDADSAGAADPVAFFDSCRHKGVVNLVDSFILPCLIHLLECGLRRGPSSDNRRTLWNVAVAFGQYLSDSSRTLPAVDVAGILELVYAISDTSDDGRYITQLQKLSSEQLACLRMRLFLRECMNRGQIYGFVTVLFPPPGSDGAWLGGSNPLLGTLYRVEECPLLPREDVESEQILSLVERIGAFPFVLSVAQELYE